MKKYLYEIDVCGKNGFGYHCEHIPFMPKVLAEKTAKAMNKAEQKLYGRNVVKYSVSKTMLVIKEGTPHGYSDWFEFYARIAE